MEGVVQVICIFNFGSHVIKPKFHQSIPAATRGVSNVHKEKRHMTRRQTFSKDESKGLNHLMKEKRILNKMLFLNKFREMLRRHNQKLCQAPMVFGCRWKMVSWDLFNQFD